MHFGHLRIASETAAALKLPEVRLIPSKTPVHRARPGASEAQRLAMLELAVAAVPGLAVDDCELKRDSPSYTVLTLESLRAECQQRPLIWLFGIDAFMHGIARAVALQFTIIDSESRNGCNGQFQHGQTLRFARARSSPMHGCFRRDQPHLWQLEHCCRLRRDAQVPEMHRIESAAQQG